MVKVYDTHHQEHHAHVCEGRVLGSVPGANTCNSHSLAALAAPSLGLGHLADARAGRHDAIRAIPYDMNNIASRRRPAMDATLKIQFGGGHRDASKASSTLKGVLASAEETFLRSPGSNRSLSILYPYMALLHQDVVNTAWYHSIGSNDGEME